MEISQNALKQKIETKFLFYEKNICKNYMTRQK